MTEQDLSAANLDQIRKILFGQQIRDSEKRFERIEAKLSKEIQSLRTELSKRLDAFERATAKGLDELAKELEGEGAEREAGQKAITKQLSELTGRVRQVDELHTRATRKLREYLVKENKALQEDYQQKLDELAAETEAGVEELQTNSVAKEDLSSYFADIALRLVNKKQIRRG